MNLINFLSVSVIHEGQNDPKKKAIRSLMDVNLTMSSMTDTSTTSDNSIYRIMSEDDEFEYVYRYGHLNKQIPGIQTVPPRPVSTGLIY